MKQLTYETDSEHALVRTVDGTFEIQSGGQAGIDLSDVDQVLAHTHPYSLPGLGPSQDDVDMLGNLGQGTSILLEHGQMIWFGAKGTIGWL